MMQETLVGLEISEDCPWQHPVLFLKTLGCKGRSGLSSAKGFDLSQNWMKVEDLHLACLPCTRPLLWDVFHLDLLNISRVRCSFWHGEISVSPFHSNALQYRNEIVLTYKSKCIILIEILQPNSCPMGLLKGNYYVIYIILCKITT